jgi:hypothetical protein
MPRLRVRIWMLMMGVLLMALVLCKRLTNYTWLELPSRRLPLFFDNPSFAPHQLGTSVGGRRGPRT